jgi:UDP-2-acetamido-2,6-beta-L-arabino-hexul-4-ose reductase
MTRVSLTGSNGFLGWHTRAALREQGIDASPIAVGDAFDPIAAQPAISGSSRLIHLAGANRGSDEDVRDHNLRFAEQVASALLLAEHPPQEVVFANSIQAANGSAYGDAKAAAAHIVRSAADAVGASFLDLRLPNLFGEHGRPFYNAVTATFSHLLALEHDRGLTLLHAQDAADLLVGAAKPEELDSLTANDTVCGLLGRLRGIAATYGRGEIPDVAGKFDRDLFNTYRSYTFPDLAPVRLARHADGRGSFFEIIRSHGGCGQSSFSTTVPGISRGDHFHRRKIERFTVLSGSATIALRKLFTDKVHEFRVTGEAPVAVDMPTMWSHKITNTGSEPLYTSFWTNDIFDSEHPDTIAEAVNP